jgi:hypothetical protein
VVVGLAAPTDVEQSEAIALAQHGTFGGGCMSAVPQATVEQMHGD